MTAAVTHKRKRYAVPCVACKSLYPTHRTDSRTCSPACRVALHRDPDLDNYAKAAKFAEARFGGDPVRPFVVRLCAAADLLRPDLAQKLQSGEIADAHDIGPALYDELMSVIFEQVKADQ